MCEEYVTRVGLKCFIRGLIVCSFAGYGIERKRPRFLLAIELSSIVSRLITVTWNTTSVALAEIKSVSYFIVTLDQAGLRAQGVREWCFWRICILTE